MNPDFNHRQKMKLENQRKILNRISKRPTTRSAIADDIGLTQASVSMIADDLIKAGIVLETEKQNDEVSLGRKPSLLDLNPEWGYTAGIKINRDFIDVGLVDMKGRVIDKAERIQTTQDYCACLDMIAGRLSELLGKNPDTAGRVMGAGVAIPGPYNPITKTLLNPPGFFKEWYYLNLHDELAKRLDMYVHVEHDSAAHARAENYLGNGTSYSNFLVLYIGAGFGSGIVLGGKVMSDNRWNGGELGHTVIEMNGRPCTCGNCGCIEQYASVAAILHEAGRLRPEITTWEQLVDAAYDDDIFCRRYIEIEASYISLAIVNMINLLAIDAAFLSGAVTYRPEMLLNYIRTGIGKTTLTRSYHNFFVDVSGVRENNAIAAGASIIIDRLFNKQLYFYQLSRRMKVRIDDEDAV